MMSSYQGFYTLYLLIMLSLLLCNMLFLYFSKFYTSLFNSINFAKSIIVVYKMYNLQLPIILTNLRLVVNNNHKSYALTVCDDDYYHRGVASCFLEI